MTDAIRMDGYQRCGATLTPEDIREFQRLVHETTGVWFDASAASRRANQLLYLTRALIGRLPEEDGGESSNVVPLDEIARIVLK
jgi:hypothetical protein